MRYRLQRHDGTDCSATMVPITVLRMVPIQRYRHIIGNFDFPLPPYKEQIRIVETVQRIFDQLDVITESL